MARCTLFVLLCFFIISSVVLAAPLDDEVLRFINIARTNPKGFVQYVKANPIRASAASISETVNFLNSAAAVPALTASAGLAKAALDHVKDQGPKGLVGHTGTDGSTPSTRINKYGKWTTAMGENISFGYNNAATIVVQLIVDENVAGKGHRVNIFNPKFKVIGIASGPHTKYNYMCTQDFAGGFTPL